MCVFGTTRSTATYVSKSKIKCKAPPTAYLKTVAVSVLWNGVDECTNTLNFSYVELPEVRGLVPKSGTELGGTVVRVTLRSGLV